MKIWVASKNSALRFGARGGAVFAALRCKPKGRGFDSHIMSLEIFIDNPSGRTMIMGFT